MADLFDAGFYLLDVVNGVVSFADDAVYARIPLAQLCCCKNISRSYSIMPMLSDSRTKKTKPLSGALTHVNDPAHSAAHIESSALISAPPPPRIAHGDLLYRLRRGLGRCSLGIYSLRLVCCIGPSWRHGLCLLRRVGGRLRRRRARMLDAPTCGRKFIVGGTAGLGMWWVEGQWRGLGSVLAFGNGGALCRSRSFALRLLAGRGREVGHILLRHCCLWSD